MTVIDPMDRDTWYYFAGKHSQSIRGRGVYTLAVHRPYNTESSGLSFVCTEFPLYPHVASRPDRPGIGVGFEIVLTTQVLELHVSGGNYRKMVFDFIE